MQATANNYIIYILTLPIHFACSLGENNGLFREESNETEEVSIYQNLYSTYGVKCVRSIN